MAYTVTNFKTKKQFKEAVANWQDRVKSPDTYYGTLKGVPVKCYQPGLGPDLSNYTGAVTIEGPHYPAAHTWYAIAEMVNGVVIKVK